MEFRHLRYFLAVAEHRSVAEAARHLHVVQPALSRQIRDLEEELGAFLFVRSIRGVELTAAGRQLVVDATRLLDDLQMATERVSRIASGQLGALRIGVSASYSWHPSILRLLREFRTTHPNIAVTLEPVLAMKQIEEIADGSLDGGFLALRDRSDKAFFGHTIFGGRLMLAVPRQSNLARKPPATLAELKDEPCIWFARENAPSHYDFWIDQCQRGGFVPRLVEVAVDTSTILGFVAAGMGYSIVPDVSEYSCPPDAQLISHPDLSSTYEVEFVWSADAKNPALDQFIQHFRP